MKKNRFCPEIFDDIPWSTADVLDITLEKLADGRRRAFLLKPLRDIDTLADLQAVSAETGLVLRCRPHETNRAVKKMGISVIVPVFREAKTINGFLETVQRIFPSPDNEIIVVDGSPEGETLRRSTCPDQKIWVRQRAGQAG